MFPLATLTGTTATGDLVVGPGAPNVIANGLPVALVGDAVAGPMCVGTISASTSMVVVMGRPAATLTSMANGTNPAAFGAPAATPVVVTAAVTCLG